MRYLLNKVLYILKYILYVISVSSTFYIVLFMYQRLDKSMIEAIPVFLPYFLLLICFSVNMIKNQTQVKNNFFYNFICCFVFFLVIYVSYRTCFDSYMISYIRLGYDINFSYFSDMITPILILLYGLSLSNILLMISAKK